ncbi:MAG: cytochrome B [Saccharolobus sp.]
MGLTRRDFMKLATVTGLTTWMAEKGLTWRDLKNMATDSSADPINIIWTGNGWCGGDTVAFIHAMNPALEDVFTQVTFNLKTIQLRQPSIPELGNINLVYHPILMPNDDMAYPTMQAALAGEFDPYILVVEGSMFDEFGLYYSKPKGSFWCSAGRKPDGTVLLCDEFVYNLMKRAAIVVATGACAIYGGIPSTTNGLGKRSPTYTMGMLDDPYRGILGFPAYLHQVYEKGLAPDIIDQDIYSVTSSPYNTAYPGPSYHWLSKGYGSLSGQPIIAMAGDPAAGDWIMRTLVASVLYLRGLGPAPAQDLDIFNRPKYFYGNETHQNCPRAGFFAEGKFASKFGDPQCAYSLGCKGTEANSPAPRLGWVGGVGGCTRGGVCIACTAPGFPDLYEPFYSPPNAPTVPSTTLLAAAIGTGIVVGVGSYALARFRRSKG